MPLPLSGLDALMQGSTIRHFLVAAKNGDAAAQFNLGVLYDSRLDDNGYAIEGNRAEAMKWLLAAAEQGLPRAQIKLAEMYAGVPVVAEDFVHACAWFLLATRSSCGIHPSPQGSIRIRAYFRASDAGAAREGEAARR